MKVDILFQGKFIGSADLDAVDPPMDVAGGRFFPNSEYDRRFHAHNIEGEDNDLGKNAELAALSAQYGALRCEGVMIEDFADSLREIQVVILGLAYPEYEKIFAFYPAFKAYYQS